MGLLNLTESERLEILNLHNNAKIIKEQSTVPTAATTMDRKTLITKIQNILKTKYNANLGTTGVNKDGIDGTLGPKTLAALTTAMANKGKAATSTQTTPTTTPAAAPAAPSAPPAPAPAPAPAAAPAAPAPAAPSASGTTTTQTAPATTGTDDFGAEAPQPQLSAQSQQALSGQLTPQQIRQQGRFDQRLARQARRNTRRAGQQGQQQ
jgi:hypothetical protein